MNGFLYNKDKNGIVTITMDMVGPVNTMNAEFRALFFDTVLRLEQEGEDLRGVILTSAKKSFFAGGDLKELLSIEKEGEKELFEQSMEMKAFFRSFEKLGKPIVAAINGSALGGGYELSLLCHHRIAIDDTATRIGFPEVTLGLLPGAGGTVRLISKLGLEKALPFLLEGKQVKPQKALKAGLIEDVAHDKADMIRKAESWIMANPSTAQPWDKKGYQIPGGDADNTKINQIVDTASATLRIKTRGLLPAPEEILNVAEKAMQVDFDAAQEIESQGFTKLVVSPEAKNLITTFFFQMNELKAGGSRPKGIEKSRVKKLGILGAGMMGQGIALVSAQVGIEVILKDISIEAAEKGKVNCEKVLSKAVAKGRMDETGKTQVLGLIKPTAANEDLNGCDLIIEAVFENINLKAQVIQATEPYLTTNGVFGSNTSTLPITELSKATAAPENFIGIHFFSPVEKMPLVEIIIGEITSVQTLAKAFDYVQQIKKTPIVVKDSRGFFTSRVFATFLDEGCRLLKEGVDPVLIDNLACQTGMPVGPLAIHDEVSQELSRKLGETNQHLDELRGENYCQILTATNEVIKCLIEEHGRKGRAYGGGFYNYPKNGKKNIWPGLYDLYFNSDTKIPHEDIKDRILFRQIIESLRCYQEGVFKTVRDGNIGSILGIGFPSHTGGVLQHINTYGVKKFKDRANELSMKYGERFEPPEVLLEKVKNNELFI